MDISKMNEIKQGVLEAVKNHQVGSAEHKQNVQKWFYQEEYSKLSEEDREHFKLLETIRKNGKNFDYDELYRNYMLLLTISYHTSDLNFLVKSLANNLLKRAGFLKQYKKAKKGFRLIETDGHEIEVGMISKKVPDMLKHFPELVKFKERTGYCHFHSICLANSFANDNVCVATGIVTSLRSDINYLHSWVELTANDSKETVVLDFNMNASMRKDDYYRIRGVEPLSYVSKTDIEKYIKTEAFHKGGFLEKLDYKELLLFFDDIMKLVEEDPSSKNKTEPQPTI